MIVRCPTCSRVYDDAVMSTTCYEDGHYPIGSGPASFCKRCDLYKPCLCDDGITAVGTGSERRYLIPRGHLTAVAADRIALPSADDLD